MTPEWAIAAAKEVIEAEGEGALFRTIRNEMEATEGRRAGTDRDATARAYERLGDIIARHAPQTEDDKPIARGDVVQLTQDCTVRIENLALLYTAGEFILVSEVTEIGIKAGKCEFPLSNVTRIGKAKF